MSTRTRLALIVLFAVYASVTLVTELHHEPWRDEAETWLSARDLPWREVTTWTNAAGTPFLWNLVTMPLARGGAPYASFPYLHLLIAWGFVAVYLAYAPFHPGEKALFVFSFYPLYEYAIPARNYAPGILLVFLLAAVFPRRQERPLVFGVLVALLFNINAHSSGLASAAVGWFVFEAIRARRRDWKTIAAVALMVVGGGVALLQVVHAGAGIVSPPDFSVFLDAAGRGFVPWRASGFVWWALLLLATVAVALRKQPPALVLFGGGMAMLAFIFTVAWVGDTGTTGWF